MTRDEQKQITEFIERAVEAGKPARSSPVDVEADAIIRALFVRKPEAAYRITMLAISQEKAMEAYRDQLVEANAEMRKSWLTRLLSKRQNRRRDPRIGIVPGSVRQ